MDPSMVEGISEEKQIYIIDRDAQWAQALAAANAKAPEALQACADYNRRLREAQGG